METGVNVAVKILDEAFRPILEDLKDLWPSHCIKDGGYLLGQIEALLSEKKQYLNDADKYLIWVQVQYVQTLKEQLENRSKSLIFLRPIPYFTESIKLRRSAEHAYVTTVNSARNAALQEHLKPRNRTTDADKKSDKGDLGNEAISNIESSMMVSNVNDIASGEARLVVSGDVLNGKSESIIVNNTNTATNGTAFPLLMSSTVELEVPEGSSRQGQLVISNHNTGEGGSAHVILKSPNRPDRVLKRLGTLIFSRNPAPDDSETGNEMPSLSRTASMAESICSDTVSFYTACEGDSDSDSDEATVCGDSDSFDVVCSALGLLLF
ncbi:unnamed protein product [Somion occarium]|uniref:Uncharacterized protein n=1 Tax=Somion occarium TaxID=3059160 RepID=A0ABP1DEC8_9APHY